jgi:hypothetical protein
MPFIVKKSIFLGASRLFAVALFVLVCRFLAVELSYWIRVSLFFSLLILPPIICLNGIEMESDFSNSTSLVLVLLFPN